MPVYKKPKAKIKNLKKIRPIKRLEAKDSVGAFSHDAILAKKHPSELTVTEQREFLEGRNIYTPDGSLSEKYQHAWFLKKEGNSVVARREVVAQELFRLFIPGHAKTRLALDSIDDTYVLSKQIQGFKPLASWYLVGEKNFSTWKNEIEKLRNNITQGIFTGLGEIVVIAVLLNEIDLKLGNMGVDDRNRIVKIDGDWCFARLRDSNQNSPITKELIETLPLLPQQYSTENWLEVVTGGSPVHSAYQWLDSSISQHPGIRAEINKTLLKVLAMPEELMGEFFEYYLEEDEAALEETLGRKEQFKQAALQNTDFLNYLKTEHAQTDLDVFIEYVRDFTLTGKDKLVDQSENAIEKIRKQYADLQSEIKMQEVLPTQSQTNTPNQALEVYTEVTLDEVREKLLTISNNLYSYYGDIKTSSDATPEDLKKADACIGHLGTLNNYLLGLSKEMPFEVMFAELDKSFLELRNTIANLDPQFDTNYFDSVKTWLADNYSSFRRGIEFEIDLRLTQARFETISKTLGDISLHHPEAAKKEEAFFIKMEQFKKLFESIISEKESKTATVKSLDSKLNALNNFINREIEQVLARKTATTSKPGSLFTTSGDSLFKQLESAKAGSAQLKKMEETLISFEELDKNSLNLSSTSQRTAPAP